MKTLFVTNACPHYRVGAFEELARHIDVEFFFFADEKEWSRESTNCPRAGDFRWTKFRGWEIFPRFRIAPLLYLHLLFDPYDAVIKCTNGRVELPLTYLIARLRRKKFILWQTMWQHPKTILHKLDFPFLRHIWMQADVIVVYGSHVRDFLLSHNVPAERILIARQAVDNSRFSQPVPEKIIEEFRAKAGLDESPLVVYVGRIVAEKGLDILLQAEQYLDAFPHLLVLAGDGSLRAELEDRCSKLGLDRVRFIGYVHQDDLPALYANARAVVLPSVSTARWKEPWGLVVNEAMNQGCPVVVSDAVGAAVGGLVESGSTGFVVPEGNPHALADAIAKILQDKNLAQDMGAAARDRVRKWTFETWANGFVEALSVSKGGR
jgi:glycosyltransferase involved in cell wall biosynthesis